MNNAHKPANFSLATYLITKPYTLSLWERWQPARADGEGKTSLSKHFQCFGLIMPSQSPAVTALPKGELV